MNLRRTIATLLAALMLLALTACGAGTTPPAQDANNPAEETTPSTTESSQFRVGMECAYAPSNWQESAATDTNVAVEKVAGAYAEGYDVQIARILADQLGKELVIVKLSWDGLIDALNQGQIDAIIAGMMDTAERRESINFSDPYKETIYSMMVLAGSPYENAASIQDFSGAAVLGQQGTALDDVIDQIEGVEHLSPVGSVPDMISRLQQGTCDAIVINEESAPGYLASNPDFRLITFSEGNGFTLPAKGSCVGLRKSDTELLAQVNEILATIDSDARSAETAGCAIPEIFATGGEAAFRALEREATAACGALSGKLLLTGGGVVKTPENYAALHQNGRIYQLLRPLELLPTDGRPLSQGADLAAMWAERAPLYERFRDAAIDNSGTVEQTAQAIWRDFCENSGH